MIKAAKGHDLCALKKHLEHLLAAVLRIADQPLPLGIDDEVGDLQRDDADQGRAIIGELSDFDSAIAPLNREPDRTVHSKSKRFSILADTITLPTVVVAMPISSLLADTHYMSIMYSPSWSGMPTSF